MSKSKIHAGREYQRTRTGGQVDALLYKICGGDLSVLKAVEEVDGNLSPAVIEAIRNNRLPYTGNLPIWGTIINGTGPKTSQGFYKKLKKGGISYSKWVKDILLKPDFQSSIASKKTQIDLCVMTTEDILDQKGENGTTQEIYTGIGRLNGNLLTAESAPNILFQLGDQLKAGESILVAMNPIKDSDDGLRVFNVRRYADGELWLHVYYYNPDFVWGPGNQWVFSIRK